MLTVLEYLRKKYGRETAFGMLYKEAKILGIPIPLEHGWVNKYANKVIDAGMLIRLVEVNQKRKKNKYAKNALVEFGNLDVGSPETIKPEIIKTPLEHTKDPAKRKKTKLPDVKRNIDLFIGKSKIDVTSSEFLSSFEWRSVRMMALKKHGAVCQCCGASPKTGAVMHVDHIKPRKTHPKLALDVSNLQVLCDQCNHGKGNWDTTDWR